MSVSTTYAAVDAVRPGGFWLRVVAVLIDTLILFIAQAGITLAAGAAGVIQLNVGSDQAASELAGFLTALNVIASAAYYISFTATKGATPGKMALGLRVVREDSVEPVGFGTAFLREVVGKLVACLILMIGILAKTGVVRA